MNRLSKGQIKEIHEDAKKEVKVHCDEYHAHGVKCLTGDAKSITICKLVEHIEYLEHIMEPIKKHMFENMKESIANDKKDKT